MPDATLGNESSVLIPAAEVQGNPASLIEGGALRGSNLFHSFQDFNVLEGQRVYFASPDGISSILSRVTGSAPSNIFGTLGVNGPADLFLLNPNGMVFGETATLDIPGAFYAATAEAIPLGDGVYSATAPEQSSLLTVNPRALFSTYLTEASGDITNQGQLFAGESLTLAANQLNLTGIIVAGDTLTLLAQGAVAIADGIVATFETADQTLPVAHINIQGEAVSVVNSTIIASAQTAPADGTSQQTATLPVGGSLVMQGNTLSVINSILSTAGFRGQRGDIRLTAADTLEILATEERPFGLNSSITGSGTAGEIAITATNFHLINTNSQSNLSDLTLLAIGQNGGNGGNISLDVGDTIRFEGSSASTIALANQEGAGVGGNIRVSTTHLNLQNGGRLLSGTGALRDRSLSGGNAGNITIEARGTVQMGGFGRQSSPQPGTPGDQFSGVFSAVLGGKGEAGTIRITADRLQLDDQASIGANSSGTGRAGDIQIATRGLQLRHGASIGSSASGIGPGGNIILDIDGSASFAGASASGQNPSGLFSRTFGEGDGGTIRLRATQVDLLDGAIFSAETVGAGNAGNIVLDVAETIYLEGVNPVLTDSASRIDSSVSAAASGNGGDIRITAGNLRIRQGSHITAALAGTGNAGDVVLTIHDTAAFDGENPNGLLSGIYTNIRQSSNGTGGDIRLTANQLVMTNGAILESGTFGQGAAGNIELNIAETARFAGASADNISSGAYSSVEGGARGTGGTITLSARNGEFLAGGRIQTGVFGTGDAGDIILTIAETASFDGSIPLAPGLSSGVFSSVSQPGIGTGGDIFIRAGQLKLTNSAALSAASSGAGNAGNIEIALDDQLLVDDSIIETASLAGNAGGRIDIVARAVRLVNDGDIATDVQSGVARGGDITITADTVIALDDGDILAFSADGQGGNIVLNTAAFFGENFQPSPQLTTRAELNALDQNDRVDLNATGGVASGVITRPEVSFIENDLADLSATAADVDTLTASSCIVRRQGSPASFTVTGRDSLPPKPGDMGISAYPTGTVQAVEPNGLAPLALPPLQEPDGVYYLPDGRLVLSRACPQG